MTGNSDKKQSKPVNVRYDKGPHWRAHIGYVLIPNDDLIEEEMYRVTPEFILEYARNLNHPDAEAIFISCGGIRSLEIVDALEKQVGKPVVASNQAMFWYTIRLAGIEDKIEGYGQLLQLH